MQFVCANLHNLFPGRSEEDMAERLDKECWWLHGASTNLQLTQLKEVVHQEPVEMKAMVIMHHIVTLTLTINTLYLH